MVTGVACLAAFLMFSFQTVMAQHPPLGGGDGTGGNPYQISTPAHLKALADYVNAAGEGGNGLFYKVMNDLDMSSYTNWIPIGNLKSANGFRGTFNGNDKVIRNLVLDQGTQGTGLFGKITGATISNLGLEDCDIFGSTHAGGLVGECAGYMGTALISNCYVTGKVRGQDYLGGLVGYTWEGASIENCYSTATVEGTNYIGGLVGDNSDYVMIRNCYASGNVTGYRYVGGIAGRNAGGIIRNCVAANNLVKGNPGWPETNRITPIDQGSLQMNYALATMDVGGVPVVPNPNGLAGADATLAELQSLSFYTTTSNWYDNAWSMALAGNSGSVWNICDGKSLPFLAWQGISCIVPVTNITDVPEKATVNAPLALTATIEPEDATNQTIVWSVTDAGTTNAGIYGNTFLATAIGTAIITATIKDGVKTGEDYEQIFSIAVGEVGIDELQNYMLDIYPNPTTGKLKIENGELKIENVEIYDMYGRNLTPHTSLDISDLSNGIYFVKITTEKGVVTKKVVKQ